MSALTITYDDIPIKLRAATAWAPFMEFVRDAGVREFVLMIVDDEGLLETAAVSASAFELITSGMGAIYLSGPKSSELEWIFDEAIVAAEQANSVHYRDTTIITATLDDDESIAVHALMGYLAAEMGELRSVLIGVFGESDTVAQTRAADLAGVITNEIREYEEDEQDDDDAEAGAED